MLSQHWLTNLIKARVTPYDMKIFQQLHYVAGKLRIYMFARVTNDLSFSLTLSNPNCQKTEDSFLKR